MPAVPSSLLEPIWAEFTALLPERGEFHPDHPLGRRRRIPDRVVFEHIVEALVHGSGYEPIASSACSDATIRRRRKQWATAGIAEQVHAVAPAAYHQIIGLLLADIGADGCITKAPAAGTSQATHAQTTATGEPLVIIGQLRTVPGRTQSGRSC